MKKQTIVKTFEDASDAPAPDVDPFERARAEFSSAQRGATRLKIYRYDRNDSRHQYVKTVYFEPDVHTLDWIREQYGAGMYQLRFMGPDREWTKVVDIADDGRLPAPASTMSSGMGANELMNVLLQQNQTLLTGLLRERVAPAGDSGLAQIVASVVAGQTQIITALMSRPPGTGADGIVTAIERLTQFASDLKVDSEGGWLSVMKTVAKDVLPALSDTLKAIPRQNPPTAPGNIPSSRSPVNGIGIPGTERPAFPEVTIPSPTPAPQPAPGDDKTQAVQFLVQQAGPALAEAARGGKDPVEVADDILDSVGVSFHDAFDEVTTAKVMDWAPALATHREWVGAVVDALHNREERE